MAVNIIETNLKFKAMSNRTKTTRIILHHAAAKSCTAQQIHQWHLDNGWSGAGYHFLVRKDGNIYRLRPENKVGAHASRSNSDSLGVCFEGDFMTETMGETQRKAGAELVHTSKASMELVRYSVIRMYAPRIALVRIFHLTKSLRRVLVPRLLLQAVHRRGESSKLMAGLVKTQTRKHRSILSLNMWMV